MDLSPLKSKHHPDTSHSLLQSNIGAKMRAKALNCLLQSSTLVWPYRQKMFTYFNCGWCHHTAVVVVVAADSGVCVPLRYSEWNDSNQDAFSQARSQRDEGSVLFCLLWFKSLTRRCLDSWLAPVLQIKLALQTWKYSRPILQLASIKCFSHLFSLHRTCIEPGRRCWCSSYHTLRPAAATAAAAAAAWPCCWE